MVIPARIIASITAGEWDAGPIVATIFVRFLGSSNVGSVLVRFTPPHLAKANGRLSTLDRAAAS
jgi:hypothetical protein